MNFPICSITNSERESLKFANDFAKELKAGDIVAFTGDLGTGKTFIVKAIANYFGIDEVTSPTFSIVNTYEQDVRIHHFDFYRLKKVEELYDIGFEEYLNDSKLNNMMIIGDGGFPH